MKTLELIHHRVFPPNHSVSIGELRSLAYDELTFVDKGNVIKHLEACELCRARYATIVASDAALTISGDKHIPVVVKAAGDQHLARTLVQRAVSKIDTVLKEHPIPVSITMGIAAATLALVKLKEHSAATDDCANHAEEETQRPAGSEGGSSK